MLNDIDHSTEGIFYTIVLEKVCLEKKKKEIYGQFIVQGSFNKI